MIQYLIKSHQNSVYGVGAFFPWLYCSNQTFVDHSPTIQFKVLDGTIKYSAGTTLFVRHDL